jgi:hypothetical protein
MISDQQLWRIRSPIQYKYIENHQLPYFRKPPKILPPQKESKNE